eukprot:gene5733-4094_t
MRHPHSTSPSFQDESVLISQENVISIQNSRFDKGSQFYLNADPYSFPLLCYTVHYLSLWVSPLLLFFRVTQRSLPLKSRYKFSLVFSLFSHLFTIERFMICLFVCLYHLGFD